MPIFGGGVGAGVASPVKAKPVATGPTQADIVNSVSAFHQPQTDYLNALRQSQIAQQGLAGQQLGATSTFANQQYNTGQQKLNYGQQDINAQLAGLLGDQRYAGGVRRNSIADYNSDINYNRQQNRSANALYHSLTGQYQQQGSLLNQQLNALLGGLGYRENQANAQYGNDTQQLMEQAGSQGAYGSPGQQSRQSFLQSTLSNTLGGLGADRTQAGIQRRQSQSQLNEQIAQALNNRNDALSGGKRRIRSAQLGKGRANIEYQHVLSGLGQNRKQLNIKSGLLGVNRQELANQLQSALSQAGITFGSGQISTNQALAGLTKQDYDNLFGILSDSNTLGDYYAQHQPQPGTP